MNKYNKYSLPRHTILAKQSARFGAAIVDAAITLASFLILFYGCFNLIFTTNLTNAYYTQLSNYQYNSHLVVYNEETKKLDIYESDDDYTVYQTPVEYYYFSYLTGENISVPIAGGNPKDYASPICDEYLTTDDGQKILPKDYYTASWYNYNVLGITVDDPDSEKSATYFTYQKDSEGNNDLTKVGVPRSQYYSSDEGKLVELTSTQLAKYYSLKYEDAYYHLTSLSFYYDASSTLNFYNGLSAMIPVVLAGLISYVVIPLFFANGETLGKKIFKIGLANMQGYKYKKYQLLLRFIPFFLTALCVLLVTYQSIYVCLIIVAVMLLSSFGVMMASPKKCALHDYTAQTIVIDTKESLIFADTITEEAYLIKEDKVDAETVINNSGEEPELKYEK